MELSDFLVYDLWLTDIKGIGPAGQHQLLDAFGFPDSIYNASEEDLADAGISEKRRKLVLEARDLDSAKKRLEECRRLGIFLLTNRDKIYPEHLRYNPDMPVLLYGKGNAELFDPDEDMGVDLEEKWQPFGPEYAAKHRKVNADGTVQKNPLDWWFEDEPLINYPNRKVGVVGARRCTREDKEKCINTVKRIGEDLPGAIIISGGAKGIDGYSHTAAIKNGLRTIAFIGTGPDINYPKEHAGLFDQICEHGMILTEYPPGTEARPFHFPRRNRLIAGWSDEMYIIGAGRNSGTNITKQYFEKYHGGRFRSHLGE